MRNLFLFIFLLSFCSFGQNEHPDFKIPFKWEHYQAPMTFKEKKKAVKKIKKSVYWSKWDKDKEELYLNNCHFIDVDDDSLLDIVYNGENPTDPETNTTAIFKKTGRKYELVSKFNGEIRKMTRLNGRKRPIRFVVLTAPRKDEIYYRMRYFYFDDETNYTPQDSIQSKTDQQYTEFNSENGVKIFRNLYYVMNLEFPPEVHSKVMRTFNDTTFLMRKPRAIEGTFLEEKDRHSALIDSTTNNAVALILPQQKCVGIGYEITDGIPYFLITVENSGLTSNYLDRQSGMQIGWVDGRHVVAKSFRDVNDD